MTVLITDKTHIFSGYFIIKPLVRLVKLNAFINILNILNGYKLKGLNCSVFL